MQARTQTPHPTHPSCFRTGWPPASMLRAPAPTGQASAQARQLVPTKVTHRSGNQLHDPEPVALPPAPRYQQRLGRACCGAGHVRAHGTSLNGRVDIRRARRKPSRRRHLLDRTGRTDGKALPTAGTGGQEPHFGQGARGPQVPLLHDPILRRLDQPIDPASDAVAEEGPAITGPSGYLVRRHQARPGSIRGCRWWHAHHLRP